MTLYNKKATTEIVTANNNSQTIIANKTYTVNELEAIFSYNSLMLVNSKEELYKYWYMAVEIGIKKFIDTDDSVFNRRYPKYE